MEKKGKFGVICINPIPNPQSPIINSNKINNLKNIKLYLFIICFNKF